MSTHRIPQPGTNLSILVGVLSRDADLRPLPSGVSILGLELSVRGDGRPAESVPVAWPDAPPTAVGWRAGEEVLVIGRIRRRFFRAGGSTQSRTEVVATVVVPTRRSASAAKVWGAALDSVPLRL